MGFFGDMISDTFAAILAEAALAALDAAHDEGAPSRDDEVQAMAVAIRDKWQDMMIDYGDQELYNWGDE